ncbi:MAG: zinc-dependent metalloprotease [Phycisphaerales bacterium]|nr:zinc-dependent metalloprotease [Phycisphaerales bacterium]
MATTTSGRAVSAWIKIGLILTAGTALALPATGLAGGGEPEPKPASAQPPEGSDQNPLDDAVKLAMAGQVGGDAKKAEDFRPWTEVSKDFERVVSTADGETFYNLYRRNKDNQLLAELPRGWQSQKHFIAMTLPTGELFAGLQAGDMYVYWKRIDKRMVLIAPNLEVRSTGDRESKDSIENHFTDRVIIDVPIECMGPSGQPVIDVDAMLVGSIGTFYGGLAAGANARLATIADAKAFPKNIELSFNLPTAGGQLKTFHYSISQIEENPSYKPRIADERVGYFTTEYRDLGKFRDDQVSTRYINRWQIEKADPSRKLSPAKEPLIYYVEHTVPVRYRRWVKEGILYWNTAFEQIGISDAIEVYYQDKTTGAHMDKHPEDVRYNFVRWLSNDIGTAIGPSRAHPITGQILDADIVLTDGWIRHFWYQSNEYLPQIAMEGFSSEELSYFDEHPAYDPRLLLAAPEAREQIMTERFRRGIASYGGQPISTTDAALNSSSELVRLSHMLKPRMGLCMAAQGMARDMAMMGQYFEVLGLLDDKKDDKPGDKKEGEKKDDTIDDIPESFVGPALAHLTVHEVGHTLGLRHNFKASSIYSLADINKPEMKGKAFTGSVMDYTPVNINLTEGAYQGEYSQVGVGPYDMWAIEYGYGFGDTKETLKKVSDPMNTYGTDEDTGGPDPLARRYDFTAQPMEYAQQLVLLSKLARTKLLDKFVKDGEPWSKARRGYEITLGNQTNANSIVANWIGGALINRDRKGDPSNRNPVNPVSAETQRAALKFIIDNAFNEDSYGLTPDILVKMSINKDEAPGTDATWPVTDRISGVAKSALSMVMTPSRLQRVYDNETFVDRSKDAFTLPELLDTVTVAIWKELDGKDGQFTARQPMISAFRRSLQQDQVNRLIGLSIDGGSNSSSQAIASLATLKLKELKDRTAKIAERSGLDPYSKAHLTEVNQRITKALDAQYVYNGGGGGGGNIPAWMLMREQERQKMVREFDNK